MPERIKPARASLELDGTMSHRQVADALGQMVFTSAKDWTRTVRMDQSVRNLIVKTLRASYSSSGGATAVFTNITELDKA